MKSIYKPVVIVNCILFLVCTDLSAQKSNPESNNPETKENIMQQILIDKFIVPSEAKQEFMKRLNMNIELLETQPGLIETTAYEQTGGEGKFNYVTTAVWESEKALENAKKGVKSEYQKQGFNPSEMFDRLGIKMDRAIYEKKIAFLQTKNQNKEIVRRLYEDCLNERNLELLKEFVADDYEGIRGETGPEGFAKTVQSIITAFPDIQWTIEDLIAEGDKVVVRWSWKGTHTGTFGGIFSPTQKHVTDHAIAIYQFRNSKIIKAWIRSDRLGFLQQIGAIPKDLRDISFLEKEEN